MNEKDHAVMESHCIAASDAYFEARPQIDCNDRRKVFDAGFERGWEKARAWSGAERVANRRRLASSPGVPLDVVVGGAVSPEPTF